MKKLISMILLICLVSFPAMADHHMEAEKADMADSAPMMETVNLIGNDQQSRGGVSIADVSAGMLLTIEAQGLSEGWHAFHIHETGDCSDIEAFKSAGGHAALEGQGHGMVDESTPHIGDLPNIWAHADGIAKAQVHVAMDLWDHLHDEDGSAFMIHAGADDYKTDPAGAAGSRVACGVIFPKK